MGLKSYGKKVRSVAWKMDENNSLLIGKKLLMNYLLACVSIFHVGEIEVLVNAGGRAISRAVDVVDVTGHRFMPNIKVQIILIGTDRLGSF